jgi:hypothetical protein
LRNRHRTRSPGARVAEAKPLLGVREPTSVHARALGSVLHDYCTGVEKLLKRTIGTLDGASPAGPSWHQDLSADRRAAGGPPLTRQGATASAADASPPAVYAAPMHRSDALLTAAGVLLTACGSEVAGDRAALGPHWSVRLDEADARSAPQRFREHADSIEVTQGPNATLWHTAQRATGAYRLSTDVTHLDSGLHPHGAGLVLGGSDVERPSQSYTYFLVRGDGHFLIKTRKGDKTADVVPWTQHEAVAVEDEAGVTRNRLAVEVGERETVFAVNGREVHRAPTAELPTEGHYGLRLVHDLHVRFRKPQLETLP